MCIFQFPISFLIRYGGDAHTVLCESAPGESKEAPTLAEFLAAQNGKQDDPSAGRCDSDYVVRCSISCNKGNMVLFILK